MRFPRKACSRQGDEHCHRERYTYKSDILTCRHRFGPYLLYFETYSRQIQWLTNNPCEAAIRNSSKLHVLELYLTFVVQFVFNVVNGVQKNSLETNSKYI